MMHRRSSSVLGLLLSLMALGYSVDAFAFADFLASLGSMNADDVRKLAADNTFAALSICFLSGILTSFTPCVYPVIPITINIFSRAAHASHAKTYFGFSPKTFLVSVFYVAGMCTTYSIMGLISGLTGSLFGNLLQSPYMLLALTTMFIALFLGQVGVYSLALPASWQNRLSQVGHTRSKLGVFLMGVVAGLIVSPCVGPIITGILTFVFESSNAFLGFLYFFAFSLGLGVLFLVIGGFSGIISRLPRSGNWMKRVNYLLAGLLLIAAAYYGTLFLKRVGLIGASLTPKTTTEKSELQWFASENSALDHAKQTGTFVLLDFSAEWCEACHELDREVFTHPTIIPLLKKMTLLRIDMTEDNEEISTIREKYGIVGLPTVLVLDKNGAVLKSPKIFGKLGPDEFSKLIEPLVNN